MTNRRTMSYSILAAAFLALCLPMVAAAQWPDYGRNRDRNDQYGRYDERYVRDSVHRLDRLAKDFERQVDRSLDRSRRDGTRNEDRINNEARQFRNAVGSLKSRFGNGRDLNRSRNEAQRVMQEAQGLNRVVRLDNRLSNQWYQIQRELEVISSAYNLGYNNGTYRTDRNGRRTSTNDPWYRRLPLPY